MTATTQEPGPSPVPLRLRYTAYEACVGIVVGLDPCAPPFPEAQDRDPRTAMEQVALTALLRPPCLVSFSGGRDSSSVLAIATHVARREGLAAPIPVTNRFPAAARSDESAWQEEVVRHLGLTEWERLEWHDDELDLLGPFAAKVYARHGLAYPPNLHFHEPLLERAAGGSLLTGVGGDEIFASWLRATAREVLLGRRVPRPRELPQVAADLTPRRWRMARQRRRSGIHEMAWLRPEVRELLVRERAAAAVGASLRWDDEVRRWWRHRYVQAALGSLRALGGDHDVLVLSPFTEGRTLAAWAADQGPLAPPGRTTGLRRLVGDLLPASLLERRTKAFFDEAFNGRWSKAFAAGRPTAGLDDRLVDIDRLHEEWLSPDRHAASQLLLRVAWAASRPAGVS